MDETRQKHPGGRPRKYSSPEEMQELIDKYFEDCDENQAPKTIYGLANALDLTYERLWEYQGYEEFSELIKRAKQKIIQEVEEEGRKSTTNPAFRIFWMKNVAKWADKQEIDVNTMVGLRVDDDIQHPDDSE